MSHGDWGTEPPNPITASKLFNAARATVILLVESGSDKRFWDVRAAPTCRVDHQGQGGRAAALERVQEAEAHPDAHLLAVLDADLDRVLGALVEHEDVVWTDRCDLESTLLALPALDFAVTFRVGRERLADWEAREGETVRERLEGLAEVIGRLRLYCRRNDGLTLRFRKFRGEKATYPKYKTCFGKGTWEARPEDLIQAVLNFSELSGASASDLWDRLDQMEDVSRHEILNGHDQIELPSIGLEVGLGRKRRHSDLADDLVLAVDIRDLEGTRMVRAIREWEVRVGIKVIKSPS